MLAFVFIKETDDNNVKPMYLTSDLTKSRSIKIRNLSLNFPDLGKEGKKSSLFQQKRRFQITKSNLLYTYTYKVFLGT
jgi:hypothetical protein